MDFCSILDFLEDKSILVTGAAGFLAKVFIEKVLRVQPNVKKLYLLLRAADQTSVERRFKNEVIATELFRVMKKKYEGEIGQLISDKVQIVCGDIAYENLGVKDYDLLEEMFEQVDVVLNLAANTSFDGRYDVSLQSNTFGVMHVLSLCKRCKNLKILVHVSTAYVSGEKEGLILETPHKMGESLNGEPGFDIFEEKKLVEQTLKKLSYENFSQGSIKAAMRNLGLERARKFGWPNTYVFTKAMGEMLLGEMKEDMPIIIIRPTIVTSTYKEPFPGWIERAGIIDRIIVEYGKGAVPGFLSDRNTVLDVIPVDMVVNAMIVAMEAHSKQPNERVIYNVGSSGSSPSFVKWTFDYSFSYFTRNPWIGKDGKPIIVQRCIILNTKGSLQKYTWIHYVVRIKELKFMNTECYIGFYEKIKSLMRLVELSEPLALFKGVYNDTNMEKLRNGFKENGLETDIFYFDPKVINWKDYFMNSHIHGVLNYNSLLSKL